MLRVRRYRRVSWVLMIALATLLVDCGGGGGGTKLGSSPASVPDSAGGSSAGGDSTGSSASQAASHAANGELADFPFPDGASVSPAEEPGDPRDTLVVVATAKPPAGAVIDYVDGHLEGAGYQVTKRDVNDATGEWEFTKDGLPGVAQVTPNAAGGVTIFVNLFRSDVS